MTLEMIEKLTSMVSDTIFAMVGYNIDSIEEISIAKEEIFIKAEKQGFLTEISLIVTDNNRVLAKMEYPERAIYIVDMSYKLALLILANQAKKWTADEEALPQPKKIRKIKLEPTNNMEEQS